MASIYEYLMDGPGQFIAVKRYINKKGKKCLTEYYVSYKKNKWTCDPKCKGFWMSKKKKYCKHIEGIIEELKKPNMGIIRQKSKFEEIMWKRELK